MNPQRIWTVGHYLQRLTDELPVGASVLLDASASRLAPVLLGTDRDSLVVITTSIDAADLALRTATRLTVALPPGQLDPSRRTITIDPNILRQLDWCFDVGIFVAPTEPDPADPSAASAPAREAAGQSQLLAQRCRAVHTLGLEPTESKSGAALSDPSLLHCTVFISAPEDAMARPRPVVSQPPLRAAQ